MHRHRHFVRSAILSFGAPVLLACPGSQDASVYVEEAVTEEIVVTEAAEMGVTETDAVSSILAGISAARADIARGDAIDAASALHAPADLLENFFGREGGVPAALEQPDTGEEIPVAATLALVKEARAYLESDELEAADRALVKAQEQAQILPSVATGP